MAPAVIALASNEYYFPGLYCAMASALSNLDVTSEVDFKVLDGGISEKSKKVLSDLVERFGRRDRLVFVPIDVSIFAGATLGPGHSHMTYCRILLPQLVHVSSLIYLDCDVLVFRDLSELFDFELSSSNILAAAPDSQTLTLGDDSCIVAGATNLPPDGRYFNCGVMLMNLDELRKAHFTEEALEFFNRWNGHYRFWDQSAFNFLLYGRIDELPECWNRASWRFDEQNNNTLECVLHYTSSAPWLGGTPGPAQVLFERFVLESGLPINEQMADFRKSRRRHLFRNVIAPLRALAFPLVALLYEIAGQREKSMAYQKAARYWLNYVRKSPARRRLHRQRVREIGRMKFNVRPSR